MEAVFKCLLSQLENKNVINFIISGLKRLVGYFNSNKGGKIKHPEMRTECISCLVLLEDKKK